MTDRWAQAEAERVQANGIRIGVVTAVDLQHEDGARATVKVGGMDSEWLPWLVARAGTTRTGSAPSIGEQRLIFAPYGDMTQAVIGPAIYQDDHPSPTTTTDQHGTEYPDGTRVIYDAASNTLTVDVAASGNVVVNCKVATVKATTSVTLDTPETHLTGKLNVAGAATFQDDATFSGGAVTHGGKNIGKDHTHSGVSAGAANSGPPN